MAQWFVEECENDAEVARLAIEALQRELAAAGGPEDARAKATLRYLLEITAALRREFEHFPRMSLLVNNGANASTYQSGGVLKGTTPGIPFCSDGS